MDRETLRRLEILNQLSLSEAQKVLVPLERCGLTIAGVGRQPLDTLIKQAAELAAQYCETH